MKQFVIFCCIFIKCFKHILRSIQNKIEKNRILTIYRYYNLTLKNKQIQMYSIYMLNNY